MISLLKQPEYKITNPAYDQVDALIFDDPSSKVTLGYIWGSKNFIIKMTFSVTDFGTSIAKLIGSDTGNLYGLVINSSKQLLYYNNNASVVLGTLKENTKYNLELTQSGIDVTYSINGGTKLTTSFSATSGSYSAISIGGRYSSSAVFKVYYFYKENTGYVGAEYIPAMHKNDNKLGMLQDDSFKEAYSVTNYVSLPIYEITDIKLITASKLPANALTDYDELEYVESNTFNNPIDTGIEATLDNLWKFKMTVALTNVSVLNTYLFECGGLNYQVWLQPSVPRFFINYQHGNSAYQATSGHTFIKDKVFDIEFGVNSATVDGTTTLMNYATGENYSTSGNFNIFSSRSTVCYARVYACQIIHNGQVLRDLIPAKRKSDNKAGFYDLVSNSFFTNTAETYLYKEVKTEKQIVSVMFGDKQVYPDWVEKTGIIGYRTSSASNGWSSDSWYDLGKEIIPLEGDIYFSWSMSNGSSSTSCGAGYNAKTSDGIEVGLFTHSVDNFGKNGSGSSTEHKIVKESSRVPIRYVSSYCGGGTGGGSTSYSSNGKITKWLERKS